MPNPDQTPNAALEITNGPDFIGLVRFLIGPFLESPDTLSVDCEVRSARSKVWIRVAFQEADRGRVFGRGGRNIQAIRAVVEATAKLVGWSAHLDVYGEPDHHAGGDHAGNGRPSRGPGGGGRNRPPRPRERQR